MQDLLISKIINFHIFVVDKFAQIVPKVYHPNIEHYLELLNDMDETKLMFLRTQVDILFGPPHIKNLLDNWVSHAVDDNYNETVHGKNNKTLLKQAVYTQFGIAREPEAMVIVKLVTEKDHRDIVDKFVRYLQCFRDLITKLNNATT